MPDLLTSKVDPQGLEWFLVIARKELLEAMVLSGVPITREDEVLYAELQWARLQLMAYAEDEKR